MMMVDHVVDPTYQHNSQTYIYILQWYVFNRPNLEVQNLFAIVFQKRDLTGCWVNSEDANIPTTQTLWSKYIQRCAVEYVTGWYWMHGQASLNQWGVLVPPIDPHPKGEVDTVAKRSITQIWSASRACQAVSTSRRIHPCRVVRLRWKSSTRWSNL